MPWLDDLKMYSRFAWGLRGYLRGRVTVEQARAAIQRNMAEREPNFLRLMERGVFGYPRSPYLPLLKLAQCDLGDIRAMVRQRGIEPTLRALHVAGVYIWFEEFKGRDPIVRDGQVFPVEARDFDNPYLSHYYHAETGGSTGAGSRVAMDLDYLRDRLPHWALLHAGHGVLDVPCILWRGILPDSTGINQMLRDAQTGQVPRRWFTPLTSRDMRPAFKNTLATWYIIGLGRLCGKPLPWPETVGLDEAHVIARAAAQLVKAEGACLVRTSISMAARVGVAAHTEGIDMTGVTFLGGSEPPTPGKVQAITAVGAHYVPTYASIDLGHIGVGCVNPTDVNDLHFMQDPLALIQTPRQVPGADIMVDAFCFTTLLPSTPKLMLNVESDDYGILEERKCGCVFEELGYTQHIRHVRSFRKLTGEGVTLVGSEMIHILETVLPARFGGGPLDYQLQEAEDESGLTRVNLIIHPRLAIADEAAVIETVHQALAQGSASADMASAVWRQAGTLRVKRVAPIWTARGKLNPLHLERRPPAPQADT